MMFVSFYWASIGQPNLVRFGNAAGTSFIFTANGCDLAPACGNPLDRYITFDFRNAGGASSIRFWAGNEYQDFNVLNLTYGVPEPATWALMLLGSRPYPAGAAASQDGRWSCRRAADSIVASTERRGRPPSPPPHQPRTASLRPPVPDSGHEPLRWWALY